MALEIVRRIRGNVHGTIDVTELENAVIGTEHVQRLRRVKQLAFLHYVFPGASHTRFEHSLGVMQLAGIAWDKLKVNQRRLEETLAKIPGFAALEKQNSGPLSHGLLAPTLPIMGQVFDSDYNMQVLRLAGLLHDLGHPPFSHSGDRFMPTWDAVIKANKGAAEYLKDFLQESAEALLAKGKDPSQVKVRHEVFSILMIEQALEEVYRLHPELKLVVDPRDVISVIAPTVQPAPTSPLLANGVYKLLNELIAGELDIDRMDYLLRDSRECGVVYGIFDARRILDGLCMYFNNEDKSLHVAINSSGLAAFEDYLRARLSMYSQVYFHKTAASAEAMLKALAQMLGGWCLPADAKAYLDIDEYNIGHVLKDAAQASLSDLYEGNDFNELLKDLLYRRRLWKLVYESSQQPDAQKSDQLWAEACEIVADTGVRMEQVSSLTSLTRFRPRQAAEPSRNYLRLIVKDEFSFPRVQPIEDFAAVISNNAQVQIKRIYVESGKDASGRGIPQLVREKLRKSFYQK